MLWFRVVLLLVTLVAMGVEYDYMVFRTDILFVLIYGT